MIYTKWDKRNDDYCCVGTIVFRNCAHIGVFENVIQYSVKAGYYRT